MVLRVVATILFFAIFIMRGRRVVDKEDYGVGLYIESFMMGLFVSLIVSWGVSRATVLWYGTASAYEVNKVLTPILNVKENGDSYNFDIVHGEELDSFKDIKLPEDKVVHGGKSSYIEEVVEVVPKNLWTEIVGVNDEIVQVVDFSVFLGDI